MHEYNYNLVIMHTPGFQHLGDFLTVRNMMLGIAPEIRVLIASYIDGSLQLPANAIETVNSLPTLIFSPARLDLPGQFRGTRLVARATTKWKEYQLLAEKNLPFPKSEYISSLDELDELDLGERFVIKPNKGKQGQNVLLVKAANCKEIVRSNFGEENLNLIAQQAIDTGPRPTSYRLFSVLGDAIYCVRYESRAVDVEKSMAQANFAPFAANSTTGRFMEMVVDEEVIDFGERIHRQFPMFPVLGQDIVRDVDTRQLYIVELNSGGWTWHLSSDFGNRYRMQFKLDYYGQFNALEKITRALARATIDHAS
jgi:hypothetical protein